MSTLFSGDTDRAEVGLAEAAEAAAAGGAVWAGVLAHSERALSALERGELDAAESELALAGAFVDDAPSVDYVVSAILLAVTARLAIAKGQGARARRDARERASPASDDDVRAVPWFSVQSRLELAKTHLALSDPAGAATLHREVQDILGRRPKLGIARGRGRWRTRAARVGSRAAVWLGVDTHRG